MAGGWNLVSNGYNGLKKIIKNWVWEKERRAPGGVLLYGFVRAVRPGGLLWFKRVVVVYLKICFVTFLPCLTM